MNAYVTTKVVGPLLLGLLVLILPAAANAQAEAATPDVEPIAGMRATARTARVTTTQAGKTVTVTGDSWTDTGLTLAAGEQVQFTARGSETLGDGRISTPAGLARGWKDLLRQFPLNNANTGQLIGRVSDINASVPFAIGSSAVVTAPTSGHLFLRANTSPDLDGPGSYSVTISFPAASAATVPRDEQPGIPADQLVSPATFLLIPRRVTDQAGAPGDMVNFALIGTAQEVKSAFAAAGWVAVDRSVGDAVLHGLLSTLGHQAYTEMPMSTLYLFGRPQDLSFARADPLTVAADRHHLRVWQTTETLGGRPLWVGSATHDIGFERDQRTGGTTHRIDPKIDLERSFLLDSFDAAGRFSSAAYVRPSNPVTEAHTATGGSFVSDGRIVVMALR